MNQTEFFQHYQVLRREDGTLWELGRGAMGVTYKAFDVNLRCFVALKVISSAHLDHSVTRQRFVREARAAAQLRHRNIASVFHLGTDADSFFYAMEFVDGETLDAIVRRNGALPAPAALRIALQVARALNAAARRRLLHRDIKPTNLMVVDEDEEDEENDSSLCVKVIDFGLARSAIRGDLSTQLTVNGFVGTPQYASPEQLEEKDLDARSDIYSLGVTLWFLLAGRPPFMGTFTSLISQHLTKEPPWQQLEGVPEPVRMLLRRMLQKDPAYRPQTPGELRREIEVCLRSVLNEGVILPVGRPNDVASEINSMRLLGMDVSGRARPANNPEVGSLVASRFQLTRLVGEGNAGQVFQAQDILSGEGRAVAVKVFNAQMVITPKDHESLAADVAKVRAAPHVNLVQIFALERCRERACLIMEWGGNLTLVDVLRHRGIITVSEALALLKQAVDATDHARKHDLRRLELGLHQILVAPPGGGVLNAGEQVDVLQSGRLQSLMLKIDALGAAHDPDELATWNGGVTLLPPPPPLNRDTRSSIDGLVEGSYLHALGLLFYELINGSPPPAGYVALLSEGNAISLPVLGDAGNAVLRRALSANPDFASDQQFFEELAQGAGFDPHSLQPLPSPKRDFPVNKSAVESPDAENPPAVPEPAQNTEKPVAVSGPRHNTKASIFNSPQPAALALTPSEAAMSQEMPRRTLMARRLAGGMVVALLGLLLAVCLGWKFFPPEDRPAAASLPAEAAAPARVLESPVYEPLPDLLSSDHSPSAEPVSQPGAAPEEPSSGEIASLFLRLPGIQSRDLLIWSDDPTADSGAAGEFVPEEGWPPMLPSLLGAGVSVGRDAGASSLEALAGEPLDSLEDGNDDDQKPAVAPGKSVEQTKKTTSKPRARRTVRRSRPPNFWERIFGIKPKRSR